MLSYRIKRILFGIFLLGIFGISVAAVQYTEAAGSTPALSSLLYLIGLVLGFSAMFVAVLLDPRKPKNTDPFPLTHTSLIFMGIVTAAIVAIAGFLYYYLITYPKEAEIFISTYSIGFLLGFFAVFLVYYLPEHLPHEEKQDS